MKKLLLLAPTIASLLSAGPPPGANAAFDSYIATVETRLARQHRSPDCFLAGATAFDQRDLFLERIAGQDLPGALLHHWRGTAFVPGGKGGDFDRMLRDFRSYPRVFAPEVLESRILTRENDHTRISMRVRQKHVITVTLDAEYDVTFAREGARRGFSVSKSRRISEVDAAGTLDERALDPEHEHGFLWRLNTYWTYEERGEGIYLQVEAVSLTRSIPRGLGWAVRPWVERVPRESLEFTLRSARAALTSTAEFLTQEDAQ